MIIQAASRLVTAAVRLQRWVYASLPWGVRLGQLLVKLASSSQIFGTYVYLTAAHNGAKGVELPPELMPKATESLKAYLDRVGNKAMQKGVGFSFGGRAFAKVKGVVRDNEKAEDILQDAALKVHAGKFDGIMGGDIKTVESNVMTALGRAAIDVTRKKTEKGMPEDDEGVELEVADPNAWGKLEQHLKPHDMDAIFKKLEKEKPALREDLPLYFELLIDGYKDADIHRHRALPMMQRNLDPQTRAKIQHMGVDKLMELSDKELEELFGPVKNAVGNNSYWNREYKKDIQSVLLDYVKNGDN